MKSITLYLILLAVGALGFYAADKFFDFRSNYYRSKYEKEINALSAQYNETLEAKNVLDSQINDLTTKIDAKDSEILEITAQISRKRANYRELGLERPLIDKKHEIAVSESVQMDNYRKCLNICAMRTSLGYDCGDYSSCERYK